jgi:hypothetical protein
MCPSNTGENDESAPGGVAECLIMLLLSLRDVMRFSTRLSILIADNEQFTLPFCKLKIHVFFSGR